MPFLSLPERAFLEAVAKLAYANPFLPEWVDAERAALGDAFVAGEAVWSQHVRDPEQPRANVWRIVERLETLAPQLQERLRAGAEASPADLVLYEDAMLHLLYQRYYRYFFAASFGPAAEQADPARWRFYNGFLADWQSFFAIERVRFPTGHEPRHTFACFRQIQRAFEQLFRDIIGSSMPAARLRAAVWQSIFTHDIRRYRRTLYTRMGEFATLITGPSGTGKELVARAIARVSLHAVRRPASDVRRRLRILSHQYFGAVSHAGGVGTVRPPAGIVHGRDRRPQGMVGDRAPSWVPCSSTSSAIWIRRSR